MALVIVLWIVGLGALMVSAYNSALRSSLRVERAELEASRRKAAVWAGVEIAAARIIEPNKLLQWRSSPIPQRVGFGDASLSIAVAAHSGRVDLNLADEKVIRALAQQVAVDARHADTIADRILDWRDSDRDRRASGAEEGDYRGSGLSYGPADGDFQSPQHVLRVLGLDNATAQRMAPLITVYSKSGKINPRIAPAAVLACLPGISGETVAQVIALRDSATSEALKAYLQPYQQFLDESEGPVYSIEVSVERGGTTAAPVEVTIIQSPSARVPYRVLGFQTLPAAAPARMQ